MNMNPMMLMQLKGDLDGFKARHPKMEMFLKDAVGRVETGSVLEISITSSDGNRIRTNIKVSPEDKQLFDKLSAMIK